MLLQPGLLLQGETAFYRALLAAVSDHYVIALKVRVADVLKVAGSSQGKGQTAAFNRIAMKLFDFVVCDPLTLAFAGAVELDDRSHQRRDRVSSGQIPGWRGRRCEVAVVSVPGESDLCRSGDPRSPVGATSPVRICSTSCGWTDRTDALRARTPRIRTRAVWLAALCIRAIEEAASTSDFSVPEERPASRAGTRRSTRGELRGLDPLRSM